MKCSLKVLKVCGHKILWTSLLALAICCDKMLNNCPNVGDNDLEEVLCPLAVPSYFVSMTPFW